ncbi:styrene monooxygenase/indole monooxygenase family protein [Streptomyces abikoensis]|uniref:styrene monooxygenase/indole monooxygenase family protein n=1 Tax=Streptomyces abikoensis TaxID=97398 RepID=UPI001679334B|nr:styrene monooxygenase/indole monooxygenase family protein [Streptomyces abikoensis]GGP57982.1 alanine-phosphoribitol ligase [Streptomyces abikoensis]
MRRIAIVGAGQAGLQLALGLRERGYDVTVVTARTPQEVRAGRVLSTQLMYGPALALERRAGLNLWGQQTPAIDGVVISPVDPPGARMPERAVGARLDAPAQSVDQRVKTARWLELFEERGGRVEYRPVAPEELPALASGYELTLLATGHGPLGEVFGRDERHSPYEQPQRVLACVYVHGVRPDPELPPSFLRMSAFPGAGEFFVLPALTGSGPCVILLWEGKPGGPFDCWQNVSGPGAALERSWQLLRSYAPWEYELCAQAEPTDPGAALIGSLTPVVRHPVAEVAPGSYVLGMADAVVLNDPITGQGSNNAARCADRYLASIVERGERPFDRAWMHETFAGWWEHARHTTAFTNMVLDAARPRHFEDVMAAAARHPALAHRYVNGFADPADYQEWLMDADRAEACLAAVAGRTGGAAVG